MDMTGPTVLAEMAFPTPVLQVRVNALRLVVIVLRETYVYDLATLTLVATIGTTTPLNADGIGSLSAVRVAATGHALITQGSFSAASRASFHGEGNAAAAPFGRKSSSAAPAGYLALPVQDVQMHHSPSAHLLAERSRAGSTAGMMLLRGYSGAAGGGMWDGDDGDDMSALRSARERAAAAAAAAANPVGVVALFDASNARLISHFEAHRHALTQLEFSPCGNRLATCSAKGTTIRVFSIPAGTMLHLLRRGQREALVHSISFNRSGEAIAVSSASGTVHVFRTAPQQQQDPQQSTASAAKGAGGGGIADRVELMMGTLQSTMGGGMRSVAKVHLPPTPAFVSAGSDSTSLPVSIVSLSDNATILSVVTPIFGGRGADNGDHNNNSNSDSATAQGGGHHHHHLMREERYVLRQYAVDRRCALLGETYFQ